MIDKSTIQKILSIFFEDPTTEYHLRELSRITKFSMPTIISSTDILAKKKLIIKKKGKVLTTVKANRESTEFTRNKRINNLEELYNSSIIEYLIEKYQHPKAIILFGSYSRGEDIEKSDIDLAIFTHKKIRCSLEHYNKKLNREITLHQLQPEKISKEFKKNLANGIVVDGTW